MHQRRWCAAVLLAVLVLASCSGDSTGPDMSGPGTFSAQITGMVARSVTGIAAFGSVDLGLGQESRGFGIALETDDGTEITVGRRTFGRIPAGSHAIGRVDQEIWAEVAVRSGTQSLYFVSESGQLNITASSAQSLRGSLTFRAKNEFGTGQIDVTATFNAICFPGGLSCD